jgi:hypothetical protein
MSPNQEEKEQQEMMFAKFKYPNKTTGFERNWSANARLRINIDPQKARFMFLQSFLKHQK